MQQLRLLTAFTALMMTATTMTACGGNECASGTTEKDGQCVPTSTLTCGDGTTLTEGKCVPTSTTMCGAGTTLMNGECVPTSTTECGDGTMLVGGECLPNSTLTCGTGTTAQNGVCVPTSTLACGAGTVESNGNCVVATAACGAGTQLDANAGTCVVTDAVCGTGTAFTSGSCVPTADVCATGTTFNDATGTCLPDAGCQVGDVVLNGLCVRPVQQLLASATVTEAENNDPTLGGTAQALTIPAAGTQLVVSGAVGAPTDLDGDSQIDQDLDGYTVTLAAGDLIQVAVQPVAGPSLGFLVFGPDGSNYTRASTLGLTQGAARQIFAPVAGEYTILVAPASALANNAGPIGNADWTYALTVEQLAAPTPADVDASTANALNGQFTNLSDNLFRATNLTGGLVQLTVGDIGANAEGVYYVGSSLSTMTRVFPAVSNGAQVLSLAAGENLVFFDWTEANGPDTAFSLTATAPTNLQALGALSATATASTPVTINAGETYYYTFTASPDQALRLSQTNTSTGALSFTITQADGTPVTALGASFSALAGSKVTFPLSLSSSATTYSHSLLDNDGEYLITVKNTAAAARADVTLNVAANAVTDLGTKAPADPISLTIPASIPTNNRLHYKVTFSDGVLLNTTITQTSGDPDLHIYREDGSIVTYVNATGTNLSLAAGTYYFELNAYNNIAAGVAITLSTTQGPSSEAEPNNDAATASTLTLGRNAIGSLVSADPDVFSLTLANDLAAGEALRVHLLPTSTLGTTPSYTVEVKDSAGTAVATYVSPNDALTYVTGLTAGTYTVHLATTGVTATNYTLNTSVVTGVVGLDKEPNSSAANASPLSSHIGVFYGDVSPAATPEEDYFSFTLANALANTEELTFTLATDTGRQNTSTHTIAIKDSAGVTIHSGTTSAKKNGLAAGTYNVVVSRTSTDLSYTGRYKVTGAINIIDIAEFENTTTSPINAANTNISRTIQVAKPSCTIASVKVHVNISHAYRGDLILDVTSPDGTTVRLHDETGGEADDIIGVYPTNLTSAEPLSAFSGEAADGTWTLEIEDTYPTLDHGTFNSWGLSFVCAP